MARPGFGSAYIYVLTALIGYMIADLGILYFRDTLVPTQAPPPPPFRMHQQNQAANGGFEGIKSKNIFNIDGQIPPPIGAGTDRPAEEDLPPVRTSIPGLVLVGTLVHSNPAKSIASLKTQSTGEQVGAYRFGDTINGVGEVLLVERGKLTFRNLMNRRKEFIELPQEGRINLGLAEQNAAPTGQQQGEVTVINEFERAIKREDVNRLTTDLPSILQQARAVKEGDGFRIVDIQPGSIYERLGIKPGDLIRSVNGEPVDSPQKAMELYNTLKNAGNISLGIDRNGRSETMNFTIQQ